MANLRTTIVDSTCTAPDSSHDAGGRLRWNHKAIIWLVMGLLAAFVFGRIEVPYLNPLNGLRAHHLQIRWLLLPHMLFGSIAMLLGPLQFSSRLRRARSGLHRILGRLYVACVAVSAPMAILIPIYLAQNRLYVVGTVMHAGTWLVVTLAAAAFAWQRRLAQHRQWIVRSYALTFSFVIVRIFSHYTVLSDDAFALADVTITLLLLLLADLGLSLTEGLQGPRAQRSTDSGKSDRADFLPSAKGT
jgi:hypothetical protein